MRKIFQNPYITFILLKLLIEENETLISKRCDACSRRLLLEENSCLTGGSASASGGELSPQENTGGQRGFCVAGGNERSRRLSALRGQRSPRPWKKNPEQDPEVQQALLSVLI